jgi:glycosyltransferase involved in cell wall biosynthesis
MLLQVIPSDHRRGSEVFGLDLADALRRRGRRVNTVALAPSGAAHALPVPHLGPRRHAPSTAIALRRCLPPLGLVIAHGSTTLAVTAAATLGTHTPFVYRSVGDPSYWSATWARRTRAAAYLSRATAVVALWPGAADYISARLHVAPKRVVVVPNGVPGGRFKPAGPDAKARARADFGVPGDAPVVLCLGSLTPEKDHATALSALAEIPDAWLLVVGEGPLRSPLERLAEELAPGRVVFSGAIGDPARAYASADALVLPSVTEGMPAVLIEAAMCGVPAVASDVGAVHTVVLDGVTGRLVPPGEPARLATELRDVLAATAELGAAARAHCLAHFEIDAVASAWELALDAAGSPWRE